MSSIGGTCAGQSGSSTIDFHNGVDSKTAELWGRLYKRARAPEKLNAASEIMLLPTADSRTAVWLLEWVTGASGVLTKRGTLSPEALHLLVQLFMKLPADYPLRSHMTILMAQLRRAVGVPTTAHLPSKSSDKSANNGTSQEVAADDDNADAADQNEADPGAEEKTSIETVQPQAGGDIMVNLARVVSLMLDRSVLSLSVDTEQAMPLFTTVIDLVVEKHNTGSVDACNQLLPLLSATARLFKRAIEATYAKKGFRCIIASVPSIVALLALPGAGSHFALEAPQKVATEATSGWPSVAASIRDLLWYLFSRHNIEGFEKVAAAQQVVGEPATKVPRKDDADNAETSGFSYQTELFPCIENQLSSPSTQAGCAILLPLMLRGFIVELRRFNAQRSAIVADPGDSKPLDRAAGDKRKANALQSKCSVPLEFWFFFQILNAVGPILKQGGEEAVVKTRSVARCTVQLWQLIHQHGAFRLREDPELLQSKCLLNFCKLQLRRLGATSQKDACDAPEWDGLIEVLGLDTTPFESRLDKVWAAIGDLCPECPVKADSHASKVLDPPPCVRLGVSILQTYAKLADLTSCFEALLRSLKEGPARRATSLLSYPHFLQGLESVAMDISATPMPVQALAVWEALLSEIGHGSGKKGSGSCAWWMLVLLQGFLRGMRTSEQSLHTTRKMLLRTFQALDNASTDEGLLRHYRDDLLLAMCLFGRRLEAHEVPIFLQDPQGEAATLASRIHQGLTSLARHVAHENASNMAPPPARAHMHGAVQWLALQEQFREFSAAANHYDSASLQPNSVLSGLLQLATGCPDLSTRSEACRLVCTWLPLVATLAETPVASSGDGVSGDEADAPLILQVAEVIVPAELACWRRCAQEWGQLTQQGDSMIPSNCEVEKTGGIKPWWSAANLWVLKSELLTGNPVLCVPMAERLAELAASTVEETEAATGPRNRQKKLAALVGLHAAMLHVTAALPKGTTASVKLAVLHAICPAIVLACRICTESMKLEKTKNSSEGVHAYSAAVARNLIATSARCASHALGALCHDDSEETAAAAEEAVRLFTSTAASDIENSDVNKRRAPLLIARLLATGAAKDTSTDIAKSLALMLSSLAGQRQTVWPLEARNAWITMIGKALVEPGLECHTEVEDDGNHNFSICLPNPIQILSCGKLNSRKFERSLRSLTPILGVHYAEGVFQRRPFPLGRALRIVVEKAPQAPLPTAVGEPSEAICRTVGLVLAAINYCIRSGAKGMLSFTADPDSGKSHPDHVREQLLHIAKFLVHWWRQPFQDLYTSGAHWSEMRRDLGKLIHLLCSSWTERVDDEGWMNTLLPLCLDWWTSCVGTSCKEAGSRARELVLAADASNAEDTVTGMSNTVPLSQASGLDCCFVALRMKGKRRAHVGAFLANRMSVLVEECAESCPDRLPSLVGVVEGLAVVLTAGGTRDLGGAVAGGALTAAKGVLALCSSGFRAAAFHGCTDAFLALSVYVTEIIIVLYRVMVEPLLWRKDATINQGVIGAEALLLQAARVHASSALELRTGTRNAASGVVQGDSVTVESNLAFSSEQVSTATTLHVLAIRLLSRLFIDIRYANMKTPVWTQQPHILIDVLKLLLEAVYFAPSGAEASHGADAVARLWEHFARGGSRKTTMSAARTGHETQQAKIQLATKDFLIMLIAHALDQARHFAGVDKAVQRCLRQLDVKKRAGARAEEVSRWKEAITILRQGLNPMLAALEGSESTLQGMYVSLRPPLDAMFRELNSEYQSRDRYRGDA